MNQNPMIKASPIRKDAVLIMARGDSRRMGTPKGMVKLPGASQTFLETIVSLYQGFGWTKMVIIKPEDRATYAPVLDMFPELIVIQEQGGQDTAQSVLAAWQNIEAKPLHLWVHPVDMPLVTQETIALLSAASRQSPTTILRPVYQKKPGHPVIMPSQCLDLLVQENPGPPWLSGPVRSMVKTAVGCGLIPPVVNVPINDSAVTRDFDNIADLEEGS